MTRHLTRFAVALALIAVDHDSTARGTRATPRPATAPAVDFEARVQATPGYVDATSVVPDLLVDLKYAASDNFLHRPIYGTLRHCYLNTTAAAMLAKARTGLRARAEGLRLLAYDCARPMAVQRAMWELVKGTPQQSYVADPTNGFGSVHSYGCAVDVTLATSDGAPLPMGSAYDFFGARAQTRPEAWLRLEQMLTSEELANRLLLREVMVRAGFYPVGHEWWHFECMPPRQIKKQFVPVP